MIDWCDEEIGDSLLRTSKSVTSSVTLAVSRHYLARTTFLPLPLHMLQFLDEAESTLEFLGVMGKLIQKHLQFNWGKNLQYVCPNVSKLVKTMDIPKSLKKDSRSNKNKGVAQENNV